MIRYNLVPVLHPEPPVGYKPWMRPCELKDRYSVSDALALQFLSSMAPVKVGLPQPEFTPSNFHAALEEFSEDMGLDVEARAQFEHRVILHLVEAIRLRAGSMLIHIGLEGKVS